MKTVSLFVILVALLAGSPANTQQRDNGDKQVIRMPAGPNNEWFIAALQNTQTATAGTKVSEELASRIHKAIPSFLDFFKTDQFDRMTQFYSPDATLMLPNRPAVRGVDKLAAVFRELKQAGLHDWLIEPTRIEQYGDTALEFGTYRAGIRQSNGQNTEEQGKYLVVWRRQADGRWLIHADIANSDGTR